RAGGACISAGPGHGRSAAAASAEPPLTVRSRSPAFPAPVRLGYTPAVLNPEFHTPVPPVSPTSACASRTELIRGSRNLRPEHCGNVVTIGAFDGVHLGHQAIMQQVVQKAGELNLPSLAIIFEPLPREYFQQGVARIQPFRDKVQALFAEGIQRVL